MKTSSPVIGFLCAFLVTLFVLQWNDVSLRILLWTIVLGLTLIGVVVSLLLKKRTRGWTLVALSFGIVLALFRISADGREVPAASLQNLPDKTKTELLGWVSDIPERRPTFTRYVLTVTSGRTEEVETASEGKILITDRATWPEYVMGDYVSAKGVVTVPQVIENFDYAKYLSVRGIERVMDRATLTRENAPESPPLAIRFSIARFLAPLRVWLELQITRVFPEPQASLLIGLLTGGRTGLPQNLADDFRISGLSHIVAISGYNITIILTLLSSLLFFIPLKKRFIPLSVGITLFVIFVGAGAPVVRAGIMGILGLIAIQADRIVRPRQLILWTAFFMTAWNPRVLWYDPGFQLSFLATMGIAELGTPLKKLFSFLPESFGIRESLAATIAAEIATLPVSMLLFRQLSLVAPLANLLVAPLIPVSMLTGFVATLLGAAYRPLGLLVGTIAWGILSLIVAIVHLAASIPHAAIAF